MNTTGLLMLLTIVTLALTFIAFATVVKMKYRKLSKPVPTIKTMSAEDLLEVIVGLPLSEVLSAGDSVEIIVSTNSHPIASREYVATDWHSMIKLEPTKTIKG